MILIDLKDVLNVGWKKSMNKEKAIDILTRYIECEDYKFKYGCKFWCLNCPRYYTDKELYDAIAYALKEMKK